MHTNIKNLIFDFDGTLVDSLPIVVDCANKLSKKYGYKKFVFSNKIREKELSLYVKQDLKLSIFQLPKYVKDIKRLMSEEMKTVEVVKGMIPQLKALSKKYNIMILSSNSKENIDFTLKKNKINIFKIYSDSSIFGKKYLIKKVIKKEHLKKDETIYIGDETRDIDACKSIKIPIIAVTWGHNTKKLLKIHNPDFIIDTPLELQAVLK